MNDQRFTAQQAATSPAAQPSVLSDGGQLAAPLGVQLATILTMLGDVKRVAASRGAGGVASKLGEAELAVLHARRLMSDS